MAMLALLAMIAATVPAGAGVRQWPVTLDDPDRPGRPVTAVLVGDDQPPAPPPVAVLAHATMAPWTAYLDLADHLAGRGWLVALPTTEMSLPADQADLAADMTLLAGALRSGHAALPPDLPVPHPGPWAALGHSVGGGAAVLAAAADPDVGVLAVMAPQEVARPSMIAAAPAVTAPALVLAGELDCVTPPADHQWPLYLQLASPRRALVVLRGGGHCGFAAEPEPCVSGEAGCPPVMDSGHQRSLSRDLLAPWLDWMMRGDAAAGVAFLTAADDDEFLDVHVTGVPTAAPAGAVLRLAPRGPRPAPGRAAWSLALPAPAVIDARIYDARGRQVRALATGGTAVSGVVALAWDGRDRAGRPAPAGVYLLRVVTSQGAAGDRIVLLR